MDVEATEVEDIYEEFKRCDTDGSGEIERPEFIQLLRNTSTHHLLESDIDAKWRAVLRYRLKEDRPVEKLVSGKEAIFQASSL